jgi:cold shock CspA family protein
MQGTIKDFDEGSRFGTLVTDDRREIAIDAGSFLDDLILTLRIGQRVIFDTEDGETGPVARGLRLVTFVER